MFIVIFLISLPPPVDEYSGILRGGISIDLSFVIPPPLIEVSDDTLKPKSARKAMLFSRTNTLLSIPMLYGMVAYQNPPF